MPSARSSVSRPIVPLGALHEAALGDLEDEAGRRRARLGEDRADGLDEVGLLELPGRQVDAHLQVGQAEPDLPRARLAAGLAKDPATHRHDVPGLLGEVDELVRHQQRPIGRLPADQRLERRRRRRRPSSTIGW